MNVKKVPHKENGKLVSLIGEKARNLFMSRQLLCSEAVLSVLNRGLGGDLPQELAIRLASGFPDGLAGGGCLCGALTGGVLALGLFLGRNESGFTNRKCVTAQTRRLHDRFRESFGSTCCRVLTRRVKENVRAHYHHCTTLTGMVAETAAGLTLEQRPELAYRADWEYLKQRESHAAGRLKQVAGLLGVCS